MQRLAIFSLATLILSGCSLFGGGEAKAPNEASKSKTKTMTGSKVCISDLAGVRYSLEDELERQKLTPAADCMFADIRMQERGSSAAWVLRYQRVGDAKWRECKSSEQARGAFARECIGQMIADLGGT